MTVRAEGEGEKEIQFIQTSILHVHGTVDCSRKVVGNDDCSLEKQRRRTLLKIVGWMLRVK
jgi:hypothetical protein